MRLFEANAWMTEAKCQTRSDDINWSFFGVNIQNGHCDAQDECYECWPICLYCGWYCNLHDGCCENEDFMGRVDTACPTMARWSHAAERMLGAPPWFHAAYREVSRCADRNPWRPPALTPWRAPLITTSRDTAVYYPQSLEACGVDGLRATLRSCWLLRLLPPVSLRLRFRDARAMWRHEWLSLQRRRRLDERMAA